MVLKYFHKLIVCYLKSIRDCQFVQRKVLLKYKRSHIVWWPVRIRRVD